MNLDFAISLEALTVKLVEKNARLDTKVTNANIVRKDSLSAMVYLLEMLMLQVVKVHCVKVNNFRVKFMNVGSKI